VSATDKYTPPGLLRPRDNPDMRMMLCTAGHVDHGKTRLVKLLTGCSTDRLKAEQERGLTIELGFAPCMLGEDLGVGIVDVPGHEKFVKNMVAGVSGIDMAILVVAADDGVMPQTIEHLQIMTLLGVEQGIVALTKTDLATPERVASVRDSIHTLVRGTFMENAPICPLSSETFDGVFEFFDALKERIRQIERRKRDGVFRMPVERTFVQKGFGSVVTGIPVAGTIEVGRQVQLMPGGAVGRVRGMQRFLRQAESGGFGQCLALNVAEFGKTGAQRGQVVCEPGSLEAVQMLHGPLETVATLEPPLRNAEQVKVHTGTSECNAVLYLLESPALRAGQTGLATLLLQHPIAAAAHDRFIVRRLSPAATVAGGEVFEACPGQQRPRKKALLARLEGYRAWIAGLPRQGGEFDRRRVQYLFRTTLPRGAAAPEVARRLLLTPAMAQEQIAQLREQGELIELEPGYFIDADNREQILRDAEARAAGLEQAATLTLMAPDFQKGLDWPAPLWRHVLRTLESRGRIEVRGNTVLLKRSAGALSAAEQALVDAILRLYDATGFQSPRPEDVPGLVNGTPETVRRLLELLYHDQRLIRLSPAVVLTRDLFREAQARVVKLILETGAVDSAEFKHHIGSTRKYALAILDYLDARKVTVRAGNLRKLAPNYEARLV